MNNLTSNFDKNNDALNQEKLVQLWGDSLLRLTPKQRQLIVEILSKSSLAVQYTRERQAPKPICTAEILITG